MTVPFDPRIGIDQFFQHHLTGAQLVRGLAAHGGWIIPASLGVSTDGQPSLIKIRFNGTDLHFLMFTDEQAYNVCRDKVGLETLGTYTIGNLMGYNVWEAVDDDVDFVNINAFSPNQIHYTREQIPMLRQWGSIMRVEQAIDNILATDKGFDVIKSFPSYYTGMIEEDGASYIALAPDAQDRQLAAIFTADDAAEAYIEQQEDSHIQLRVMNGESLFGGLAGMSLDGMVFNCCGPTRPRAFARMFAAEVMQRG